MSLPYDRTAQFYDLFYQCSEQPQQNQEFFLSYVESGDRVLDVGAGTGRFAIAVATMGNAVTCIEPSDAFRAILLAKVLASPGLSNGVTVLPETAESFEIDGKFDMIGSSGLDVHLLSDRARQQALTNMRRHLAPRGRLVMKFILPARVVTEADRAPDILRVGDVEYRRTLQLDRVGAGIIRVEWTYETFFEGTRIDRESEQHILRLGTRAEWCRELDRCGFEVMEEFGDYDRCAWTETSDKLLVVARAAGGGV